MSIINTGIIEISQSNASYFGRELSNDFIISNSLAANIWLGSSSNASNFVCVGSNATFTSNLDVSGLCTLSNLTVTGVVTGLTNLDAGAVTSGALAVARGGTGATGTTGSGSNVLQSGATMCNVVLYTNSATSAVVVKSPIGLLTATIVTANGNWDVSSKVGDAVLRSDSNMIFTTSGTKTGIYVASNTNYVGIGTGAPTCALDVAGSVKGNQLAVGSNPSVMLWQSEYSGTYNSGIGWNALWNGAGTFFSGSTNNIFSGFLGFNSSIGALNYVVTANAGTAAGFASQTVKTPFTILSSGNVGIGTQSPAVPLHVVGTKATSTGAGYFFSLSSGAIQGWQAAGNQQIAIKADGCILTVDAFIAASDVRMKTNVIDYNSDVYSLNPVKYEFIDKIEKGARAKYGFIAQDVESLFPEVITKSKDYVPNIFKLADVSSDNIIHVVNHGLAVVGQKLKIVIQNSTDGFMFTTVSEIVDEDHFKVSDDLSGHTSVFVYGIEVDDFHSIDHDQLLSIAINTIKKQKLVIDEILSEIADIKRTLAAK